MAGTRTRKPRSAAPRDMAYDGPGEVGPQVEPGAVPDALQAEPELWVAPGVEEAVARDVSFSTSSFRFEAWPTEVKIVTQWFGSRPEVYSKFGLPGHEGIDFVAPMGSRVFAVAPGTVKRVQATDDGNPYGIQVRIEHIDGYETIYAHFKAALVKVGDQITAGQQIGVADSTGNSTGSHLHLTLKHASETVGKYPNHIVDPTPFVKALLDQGKDGAAYVKDVIPDGTQFQPGQAITQRWTVRNTGTRAWGDGYTLAYLSGDRLGGPASVAVPATNPGAMADVVVNFQAPTAPGSYRSVWQMLAPARPGGIPAARFGERMWVDIAVPGGAPVVEPKDLFTEGEGAFAAHMAAGGIGQFDTLADLIASFEGMDADEIETLLGRLPLLAGLEVLLRGHALQLAGLTGGTPLETLTQQTIDQIVALQERLASH